MLYGSRAIKEANGKDELVMTKEEMRPFTEALIYADIARCSQKEIQAFCESETAQVLQEKQVLKKSTMMRLSKVDDEKRRAAVIVYQLAKADNDPNWKKTVEYRKKWREHRSKMFEKYGARALKIARSQQKDYIKLAAKEPNESEKK